MNSYPAASITRRSACGAIAGLLTAPAWAQTAAAWQPRYILSSAMYGEMDLKTILPQVRRTGAQHIDIWCKVHGNQREQIDAMGLDAFAALLAEHDVKLGAITRYPLGPFRLQDEMLIAKQLGGTLLVCGTSGPSEPEGTDAKKAARDFLEKIKPHADRDGELGLTLAVENHSKQRLYHPDALRYFAELNHHPALGVAFAPHHLHRWTEQIPDLIQTLGAHNLPFFYAQEHGKGSHTPLPKKDEMMQMPGFGGGLDYKPIMAALRTIDFKGFIEIFMHPVPRGVPILPTAEAITDAINQSRDYLTHCLS